MGRPPTDRQHEMFDVICEHIARHGTPPSFRDLKAAMGIGSPNGITSHLNLLKRKGLIDSDTSAGIWPKGMREALKDMARDWIETQKQVGHR